MGYILCSKNINASHICPPKRIPLLKQRNLNSWSSGKHWLLTCNSHIKCTIVMKTWNDPTVTHILPGMGPILLKIHFQHFCQKLNFYQGFMWNRLGQNVRNDRGIISCFHKISDFESLIDILQVKVHDFPRTSIFIFSV